MTNRKLGGWLLVALAIVGLAFAAPVVSAHGDEPTQGNETVAGEMAESDTAGWAAWMEGRMTDHMGPGAVEEMESHTGMTVDEMAQEMADDNHPHRGMNGQANGC
ncbi:hypothetical protein [Natronomonas amylolytica]|uniref:hypothetical protein n=1 Tax=Natronomonas amylolytica TaxID=3108498 RepID=UPI003009848A